MTFLTGRAGRIVRRAQYLPGRRFGRDGRSVSPRLPGGLTVKACMDSQVPSRSNSMPESLTTNVTKGAEPVRDEYAFVDPSASSTAAHRTADVRPKLATLQDAETAKQASSDPSRPCAEGSQAEAASSPAEIAKIEIKEGHSGDLRGASAQDKGPPVMTDLPLVIDASRSKGIRSVDHRSLDES